MNEYRYVEIEGKPCVEFITKGKVKEKVLVDHDIWDRYLSGFSWTAIRDKNRITHY